MNSSHSRIQLLNECSALYGPSRFGRSSRLSQHMALNHELPDIHIYPRVFRMVSSWFFTLHNNPIALFTLSQLVKYRFKVVFSLIEYAMYRWHAHTLISKHHRRAHAVRCRKVVRYLINKLRRCYKHCTNTCMWATARRLRMTMMGAAARPLLRLLVINCELRAATCRSSLYSLTSATLAL